MAAEVPIRDANDNIIGLRPAGRAIDPTEHRPMDLPAGASEEPPRAPHKLTRAEIAGLAAVGLLVAFIVVYAARTAPEPVSAPATTVPTMRATLAPTAAPTVAPTAAPAAHIVVAFDQPSGAVLGGFDAGRERLMFIGHYGDAWAQVRRADGSEVWLRRSDLFLDPSDLAALDQTPDLMPQAPAPRPTIAPAPAYVPAVEQVQPTPAPTEAPATPDRTATMAVIDARISGELHATATSVYATAQAIDAWQQRPAIVTPVAR